MIREVLVFDQKVLLVVFELYGTLRQYFGGLVCSLLFLCTEEAKLDFG